MQKRTRLIRGNFTSCSNTCSNLPAEMDTTYMKNHQCHLMSKLIFLCSYYRADAYIRSQVLYLLSITHILQKNKKLGSPKRWSLQPKSSFVASSLFLFCIHTQQHLRKLVRLPHFTCIKILILFSINETCMYVSDINDMENKLNSALIFFNFL